MRTILFLYAFAVVTTFSQGQQAVATKPCENRAVDRHRFVEDFRDALDKDWFCVRENPEGWRLMESGLEFLVEPRTMWAKTADAKNVLLQKLPAGAESAIKITCELSQPPKKRWEQANLAWYYDDGTMVKLGLEIENGVANIIMGRKENNQGKTLAIISYAEPKVQLRFHVSDGKLVGYFRKPATEDWTKAAETTLPSLPLNPPAHLSLQCYGGEPLSNRGASFRSMVIAN